MIGFANDKPLVVLMNLMLECLMAFVKVGQWQGQDLVYL